MQVLRVTAVPGTSGYISDNLGGKLCSVAYREVGGSAGATITLRGLNGDSVDILAAGAPGLVHGVRLDKVVVIGNGSQVVVDARTEPEFIDPTYLSSATGESNVNIVTQEAGLALDTSVQPLNGTIGNIWSNFSGGKVPKAANGGVLTGSS